tara:strand:- start:462 stop:1457 length:996 start_codon:yes stop_codon:yes gene_type:complete
MALPASGQITLNQVNVELGLTATAQISLNDSAVRGLFDDASGQISMSQGYGKANEFVLTISSSTQEANVSTLATSAGWNGSTQLNVIINSGIYVWSDNTSNAGLLINVNNCSITNSGYVIGKGGDGGGQDDSGQGDAGGPAMEITSGTTGVTITNNSNAFIAGGGGGGLGNRTSVNGGGGGAGGGNSGRSSSRGSRAGGAIGQAGSGDGGAGSGAGGGAGGGGGSSWRTASDGGAGGGGGRILGTASPNISYPGTGTGAFGGVPGQAVGGYANSRTGVAGGYNNNATINGVAAGGGGGWGASGGTPAGGKAIDDNSQSYTLTNNGTVWGST